MGYIVYITASLIVGTTIFLSAYIAAFGIPCVVFSYFLFSNSKKIHSKDLTRRARNYIFFKFIKPSVPSKSSKAIPFSLCHLCVGVEWRVEFSFSFPFSFSFVFRCVVWCMEYQEVSRNATELQCNERVFSSNVVLK